MAKIEVKFVTESKTSKAGHPYKLIEMWISNREGGWPDRPTISIMPFHARLLLQNLPELCMELARDSSLNPVMSTGEDNTSEEGGPTDPSDCPF
jgi:hypothetical protein